jgi:hypothetical protein
MESYLIVNILLLHASMGFAVTLFSRLMEYFRNQFCIEEVRCGLGAVCRINVGATVLNGYAYELGCNDV